MIETIFPDNKAHWLQMRAEDITSTEVAALFGISPYVTLFELYHRKKNRHLVEIAQNERMKWGTRLQDSIAQGIAEDQGWIVRRMNEYIRDPETRMGASFDFSIGEDGLLEIKNVDSLAFKDGWIMDGENLEAPPHIELQVQHQLAVSRRVFAYIGALVGGNRVVLIKREPDASIIAAIKEKVADFWASIDGAIEPNPDFSRDADFIGKLYSYAEPGKLFDARGNAEILEMAQEYRRLGEAAKEADQKRDAIKAKLLTIIGTAEKVTGDGFSINASVVGPAHVEYDREGYRNFKMYWKQEKTT